MTVTADSPLTKINSEKCKKIFEKVKWEDDEEWKLGRMICGNCDPFHLLGNTRISGRHSFYGESMHGIVEACLSIVECKARNVNFIGRWNTYISTILADGRLKLMD